MCLSEVAFWSGEMYRERPSPCLRPKVQASYKLQVTQAAKRARLVLINVKPLLEGFAHGSASLHKASCPLEPLALASCPSITRARRILSVSISLDLARKPLWLHHTVSHSSELLTCQGLSRSGRHRLRFPIISSSRAPTRPLLEPVETRR